MARHHKSGHANGHVKHSESNCHPTKDGQVDKPTPRFVDRLISIPLIHDGVGKASVLAQHSSIGRFAIATAASTLTTVSTYASHQPPYVRAYYESYVLPQLDRADQLGCYSLDVIEAKVPLLTQPTASIVDAVKAPPARVVDVVKSKLDYTLTTVRAPAEHAAREANKRLGTVVDHVESALEQYLPPAEGEKTPGTATDNQVVRACHLLSQALPRATERLSNQILVLSQLGRDDLSRLSLALAQDLVLLQTTLAQSIVIYAQVVQDRFVPASVKEYIQRAYQTASENLRVLTAQMWVHLGQVVDHLKSHTGDIPDGVKQRLQVLVDAANEQMTLIRVEYAREDISNVDKAKHVVQSLQDKVLPILEAFQAQLAQVTSVVTKARHDLSLPLEYLGMNHTVPKA